MKAHPLDHGFYPSAYSLRMTGEELFNQLLTLERKRSERTGDPFVLMILDVTRLNGSAPPERIGHISSAIRVHTRDTDVLGWYKYPSAVGTLFTTLRNAERHAVESALALKTDKALRSVLEADEMKQVDISFHFYPEEIDTDKPSYKSDERLYPDVKRHDRSHPVSSALKRSMDVAGSLFALLLFSPLFLVISVLIKLTSPGPVLFRQRRIGKFGREFTFLKFRTMRVNNDPEIHRQYVQNLIRQKAENNAPAGSDKPVYKIVNDPRVTPVGAFLRKTSLDELPQFLNVLKGEMSLVGPRPPIPYEVAAYRAWHRRRVIEVKPGITGLWQVYGRSRTTFDEMVRLDLRYVQQQSLLLDLKIILRTPFAVLSTKGAW